MMLITSYSTFAQKEFVYQNTFDVNKQTTAILNLENTTVAIESSTDNTFSVSYSVEFNNYTQKERQELIKGLNVDAILYNNHITLKGISEKRMSTRTFVVPDGIEISTQIFTSKDSLNNAVRKTKDSILKEIRNSHKSSLESLHKLLKFSDKDGKETRLSESNVKIFKSNFIIKVPSYMKLNINAKDAQITLQNNFSNEINLKMKRGQLKAIVLDNDYNKIALDNTNFKVEHIQGGDYTLNNVSSVLIGSISNTKITSEFSKIEIGEIQQHNTVTDFNSKLWFYNFSKDFKRFDLFSEYSKVHYFYPDDDYSLKVFGNNTINYIGGIKIEMQPSRTGEKFRLMERKAKGEGHFSGEINFDIIHGIMYSYNHSELKINK